MFTLDMRKKIMHTHILNCTVNLKLVISVKVEMHHFFLGAIYLFNHFILYYKGIKEGLQIKVRNPKINNKKNIFEKKINRGLG